MTTDGIPDHDVAAAFDPVPEPHRKRLHQLRTLVLEVAAEIGAGRVHLDLKWGQPSYTPLAAPTAPPFGSP
jgi:hypothetical protein